MTFYKITGKKYVYFSSSKGKGWELCLPISSTVEAQIRVLEAQTGIHNLKIVSV